MSETVVMTPVGLEAIKQHRPSAYDDRRVSKPFLP